MLRLSRNQRLEFKFSNFKALQVPKGWDKLFVSIVSVETGKTITKSSEALVRNGSCEWPDSLLESILNKSSKEVDDCIFKFVVAMESARSGILGETSVNMTDYMSSTASISVSLPLRKNNCWTVLQVVIQCMAKPMKVRDGESIDLHSHVEHLPVDSHDTDEKSELSDCISPKSVTSSSSKGRSSASHPGEPESRQTSFSASGSHDSYDSADIFLSREDLFPANTNTNKSDKFRQDSSSSHGYYPADDASQMHHFSFNPRVLGSGNNHSPTSIRILYSAGGGTEELRVEAKMWERNARKLMLDLDMVREELSDHSKNQANLELELSATRAECDDLRKQVERLTLLPESSTSSEVSTFQGEGVTHLQAELENEIQFQRESSADLVMQLKRSQESNMELASLLQELELEKSAVQSKANDMENSLQDKMEENAELTIQLQQLQELEKILQAKELMLEARLSESIRECDGGDANLVTEMEALKEKVEELERDCNELTDENLELLFKLKELNNKSTTSVCTCCTNLNKKVLREIDDVSVQELETSKINLESKVAELGTELDHRRSEMAKLEADLMSKEEGIAELEAKVADLEKENIHLEQNMKAIARESDITSKCFNNLQNDLVALSSSAGTRASTANKRLEGKSSELESGKGDLQLRILELEEENVQLSDCISILEAQLRHLTDESESGRLELDHFKSLAENLQDEITRSRNVMEIQKGELKQKLQDRQQRVSALEEECEYVIGTSLELQATAENLVEQCSSLQKLNGELGDQNVELNEKCIQLETKLRESSQSFSECSDKVGILEDNLSSALEDTAAKEKSLRSELEAYLQEVESKLKHAENELNAIHMEYDEIVQTLRAELSASKQNHEKVTNFLENLKNDVNNLEIKLTARDHERQQLLEEKTSLKVQVQKMALLHDEASAYKNELAATTLEKEELKSSLHRVLGECKELKMENISLVEKISTLQTAMCELEDCKRSRVALERKLLQAEDQRNELNRNNRNNCQFQRKIQHVEKDKDECLTKSRTLGDLLKSSKEERLNQRTHTNARISPAREDMKFSKNEMAKSPLHHRDSRRKTCLRNDQVQEPVRNRSKPNNILHHKEGSNGSCVHDQHPQSIDLESCPKIQWLENELANAMEANKTYKAQFNRLKSGGGQKQQCGGEEERTECTKSLYSLETELKDIRERYLHMSLQYAEVEAEREELVMKLRATKNGKRWFS